MSAYATLGIRKCNECGESGDDPGACDVEGIARIAGNLCVSCARNLGYPIA